MTEFAFLVHMKRPWGTSLRRTARDVWKLHPHGYRNFESFYVKLKRLLADYGNNR